METKIAHHQWESDSFWHSLQIVQLIICNTSRLNLFSSLLAQNTRTMFMNIWRVECEIVRKLKKKFDYCNHNVVV